MFSEPTLFQGTIFIARLTPKLSCLPGRGGGNKRSINEAPENSKPPERPAGSTAAVLGGIDFNQLTEGVRDRHGLAALAKALNVKLDGLSD